MRRSMKKRKRNTEDKQITEETKETSNTGRERERFQHKIK